MIVILEPRFQVLPNRTVPMGVVNPQNVREPMLTRCAGHDWPAAPYIDDEHVLLEKYLARFVADLGACP